MAGHPPVAQQHYPVGPGGQLRVVGHHHRGHAPLACLVQQPHHHVRDAHGITMLSIMPGIILGIKMVGHQI